MREYESKDIESVVSQISEQLQTAIDNPELIADSLDFKAFVSMKNHLVEEYEFTEQEAARQAAKANFDLNNSGLSDGDIENAVKDMVDMMMKCLGTIKENYGNDLYSAIYEQMFYGLKLEYG